MLFILKIYKGRPKRNSTKIHSNFKRAFKALPAKEQTFYVSGREIDGLILDFQVLN